jgi:hypothetical protein
MKHFILSVVLIIISSTGYCLPDYTGTYKCKGMDPYTKDTYTGTITIEPQNTVYKLYMSYDTGENSVGTGGLFDEDELAVVFQNVDDSKKVGLERYARDPKNPNKLQGYWVYLGQDKLGKEICEKQ